jgi:hypothetical protein
MTKLSAAFGKKYETALSQIRTRTFTAGGFEFKVRVPLTAELNALQKRVTDIDPAKLEARFKEMTSDLVDMPEAGIEVKGDDVIINGKSTKELATAVLTMENRIVEYVRLLIPANGSMEDITYEDIEAEWPLAVQMQIMDAISEAIQPGYKDARKNS